MTQDLLSNSDKYLSVIKVSNSVFRRRAETFVAGVDKVIGVGRSSDVLEATDCCFEAGVHDSRSSPNVAEIATTELEAISEFLLTQEDVRAHESVF